MSTFRRYIRKKFTVLKIKLEDVSIKIQNTNYVRFVQDIPKKSFHQVLFPLKLVFEDTMLEIVFIDN